MPCTGKNGQNAGAGRPAPSAAGIISSAVFPKNGGGQDCTAVLSFGRSCTALPLFRFVPALPARMQGKNLVVYAQFVRDWKGDLRSDAGEVERCAITLH